MSMRLRRRLARGASALLAAALVAQDRDLGPALPFAVVDAPVAIAVDVAAVRESGLLDDLSASAMGVFVRRAERSAGLRLSQLDRLVLFADPWAEPSASASPHAAKALVVLLGAADLTLPKGIESMPAAEVAGMAARLLDPGEDPVVVAQAGPAALVAGRRSLVEQLAAAAGRGADAQLRAEPALRLPAGALARVVVAAPDRAALARGGRRIRLPWSEELPAAFEAELRWTQDGGDRFDAHVRMHGFGPAQDATSFVAMARQVVAQWAEDPRARPAAATIARIAVEREADAAVARWQIGEGREVLAAFSAALALLAIPGPGDSPMPTQPKK